jgi:hypothetical protein
MEGQCIDGVLAIACIHDEDGLDLEHDEHRHIDALHSVIMDACCITTLLIVLS